MRQKERRALFIYSILKTPLNDFRQEYVFPGGLCPEIQAQQVPLGQKVEQ